MKLLFLLLFTATSFAAEPKVIPLYPGAAPGSESWNYPETEAVGPQDAVRRVSNITHPTLTAFLPDASTATGTAIVICPGGGFRFLSIENEGTSVARWLNSIGVAAFVLKYRVVRTGDSGEKDPVQMEARKKELIPLAIADGQQAIRWVRTHAAEWGVSPDRIGILGFSAGGHVTSAVGLHHVAESRPNFIAPIYPGTPDDISPPADAAPMFIVQADDDKSVPTLEHSIRLYQAWKKANVPAEIHIYSRGGHGFGMRKRGIPVDTWTDRLRDWLDVQGLLKK